MKPTAFLLENWWRFLLAALFDFADFTIGRIPIFGIAFDLAGTVLAVWLWGAWGGLQGLELLDFTEQVDAWIPTVTIAGGIKLFVEARKGR
jgi:hypothetical protein